jgi:hypothetical protein
MQKPKANVISYDELTKFKKGFLSFSILSFKFAIIIGINPSDPNHDPISKALFERDNKPVYSKVPTANKKE